MTVASKQGAECFVCGAETQAEWVWNGRPGGVTFSVQSCCACGYQRRAGYRTQDVNLAIQNSVFDHAATPPDLRHIRWPRRTALLAAEVRRLKSAGGRALDVGCNNGLWLAALGDGWSRFGIELSARSAGFARRFAHAEVFCGAIEEYVFEPGFFDLVTAFAVIEHLLDPRAFVQNVFAALRPGGVMILMTGDRESLTAKAMQGRWPLYAPEEHVSFFSARSLRCLVDQCGFKVVREEWRFMYRPDGLGSRWFRLYQKALEVLRFVTKPVHDHYYLYAIRPDLDA